MSSANPALYVSHTAETRAHVETRITLGVPWYIWIGVLAITSASIGGAWDVAWHRSIGRDSFWTPAHLMIQLCGVLAAVAGGWLVARATLNLNPELRAASVSILGLRAPLGVFLAAWGGIAMLTSAPFDNWWHNAYGLDVKIISPPHVLLILGIRVVSIGFLFLILAQMNRAAIADAPSFISLRRLFLYMGGLVVVGQMFFLQELTGDVYLHTTGAYFAVAVAIPVVFAIFAQASGYRWSATTVAAIYTAAVMVEVLLFPLFPAQPKLGPVYFPVTHLVPAKFPILILPSAIAFDLIWQRTKSWRLFQVALVTGIAFVVILYAVEWPFGTFLLSKASQNRLFGTMYFSYFERPGSYERMRHFYHPATGMAIFWGIVRASAVAAVTSGLGLAFGRWMRGVQR